MEHIVVSSLMKFLDGVNYFDKKQHGFRKPGSCENQLALFFHDMLIRSFHIESKMRIFADDTVIYREIST